MAGLSFFTLGDFLQKTRLSTLRTIRNKRRVVVSLAGSYLVMSIILAGTLLSLTKSPATLAQASSVQVASSLLTKATIVNTGDSITASLKIQNTSTINPLTKISISFVTTADQITWNTLSEKSISLSHTGTFFTLDSLAPQQEKDLQLMGTLTKAFSPSIVVYAHIEAYNFEQKITSNSNKISLSQNNHSITGKKVVLSTEFPVVKPGHIQTLTATSTLESANYKGRVSLVQDAQILNEYDCTFVKDICKIEYLSLASGTYQAWFLSEDQQSFSNILSFVVGGEQQNSTLSADTQVLTPFGATSIANRLSIVLKEVTSKNQVAVHCDITLTKNGTTSSKVFSVLASSDKVCTYFIDTNELFGFGEYTLNVPGVIIPHTVFVSDSSTSLPFSVVTPILITGQPIDIESKGLVTTTTPALAYTGVGDLLVFNASTHVLNTTSLKIENGSMYATITANSLQDSNLFYTAIRLVDSGTTRYSAWNILNFGAQSQDVNSTGIQVNDYNQLIVGGTPIFSVIGIRDTSGQIINGQPCAAQIFVSGSLTPIQLTSQIQGGVCQVVVTNDMLTKTGPALITFYDTDSNRSIAETRIVTITSSSVRSVGKVSLAVNPAPFATANQVIIGPILDAYDNLVTSGLLKLELGQENGIWLQSKDVLIENGFGTAYIPASLLDSAHLYTRVVNTQGEVLSNQDFATSESRFNAPSLPSRIKSDEVLSLKYITGFSNSIPCTVTISSSISLEETSMFDLASQSCLVQTTFKKGISSSALLTFTFGEYQWNQLLTITPGDSSQNFGLFPLTKLNTSGEIELTLISTPLVDKNGLDIDSGTVNYKLNGRQTTAKIENGIAKLGLYDDFVITRDTRTLFSKRILDMDVEASINPRSKSTTDKIRVTIASHDIASRPAPLKIKQLATIMSVGEVQAVKLQTKNCTAYLKTATYVHLDTLQIENNCWILLTSDQLGSGELLVFDAYSQILSATITFVNAAPQIIVNNDAGFQVKYIGGDNYQLDATLFDEQKEYTFHSEPNSLLTIKQQGLASEQEYQVRVHLIDSNASGQYFYLPVLGSQVQ